MTQHSPDRSAEPATSRVPAVPISESVLPDRLICLETGRPIKMLKRHLQNLLGMTFEEYRAKWGLPPDYPTTAPNYQYAKQRWRTKGKLH
ncbi:MucR family transcriptional regulator [Thioclava nitratireducens]|uniref:MucR family transcriptional regulator n=1 Tax=Thioclava nitratireducens TaxID=1915078 RepID=UPI00247FFB4B|nr:MucR family transcriptional regulator [Thioclava nitratireducens]WGT51755.1 MucR family transcriptional regulator [Thioclava nitratireducens]